MSIRWICLAVLLVPSANAQSPTDVTLTLASKDGRTQFRQGEAIELQLQFQASVPGKYAVWPRYAYRSTRNAEYDRFTIEPAAGAVDPLADCSAQFAAEAYSGPPPAPTPIEGTEVSVPLFLNEWYSFRKPGHYRVTADTTRLVTVAQPQTRLPMRSGVFELEVTPPDPAWAEAQLKQAAAVLDIPDPPPGRVGQPSPMSPQEMRVAYEAAEGAARTVRFLETPEAARALVRYTRSGSCAPG